MSSIVILYHSGRGHTEAQANAVCAGVRSVAGIKVLLLKAADVDAHWDDLNRAPTYFGSASADFKSFMEKTGDIWHSQLWQDKLAAGFTNSAAHNGDKLNTLLQLFIFAMQHGMHWIGLGLLPGNNSTTASPDDLNRLGAWVGAMAQSHTDLGSDKAPPIADLDTARHLGRRVALIVQHRSHQIAAAQPRTATSVEASS